MKKQASTSWRDPSAHSVQFVTVDKNVRLEVLDWGGSGRPLVLLAGLGNTAHVFDDFAPKLTANYHVYGITRRGFGASSAPKNGYSGDRLGDDVLAVLNSLKIERPVLVGHSIASGELSSVGSRHPERIGGLICLDTFVSYHSSRGHFYADLGELLRKLEQLQRLPADEVAKWNEMLDDLLQKSLPRFERDLQDIQKRFRAELAQPKPAPGLSVTDLASFTAYRNWMTHTDGITIPEAELRQIYELTADGRVGRQRVPPSISRAIVSGAQNYTDIRIPVLAMIAASDDPEREEQAKEFEIAVPSARVVLLRNAHHYVFLSNEADVLREMKAFLGSMP